MNMQRGTWTSADLSERDAFLPAVDMGAVLRSSFDKIRRRWIILAAFVAAAVALAVAYAATTTPTYTANGSVMIDPRVGQMPQGPAQVTPALLMSDALTVDSELRVLTSREVTNSTVRALGLRAEPPEAPSGLARVMGWVGLGSPEPLPEDALPAGMQIERRLEVLRRGFVRDLKVERAGDTFVIDVTYTSEDRAFAPTAVNTHIQEYLRLARAEQSANAERDRAWLSERIEALGAEVRAAETAVAEYGSANSLLTPEDGLLPIEIALNAAMEELIVLRSAAVAKRVLVETLDAQIEAGEIDAVRVDPDERTAALDEYEARYAELKQEEQTLLLSWSEDAAVVRKVRQELDQIRSLIIAEYRLIQNRLRATSATMDRQVEATEAVIDDLGVQYGEDARRAVALRGLEREAEAKRVLYEQLLEEYNSASQMLSFDGVPARVIAWAVPPDSKSAPQSRQVLTLAVFAALLMGVGTIFLIEALDSGLRTRADAADALDLPLLGTVPALGADGALDRLRPGTSEASGAQLLAAVEDKTSPTSVAMRSLHGQMAIFHHETTQGGGASIVGLAGSVEGEGTTTTATALAHVLADRGERVLLLDLDLTAPGLSGRLPEAIPPGNRLDRLIEGGADLDLAPSPDRPGLTVVGTDPDAPPRSLPPREVERLHGALQTLRSRFDYVVVDLPPAHGTADARLLTMVCDGLVFVVRWGHTPRDRAVAALDRLGIDRSRILGVVYGRAAPGRVRAYDRFAASAHA